MSQIDESGQAQIDTSGRVWQYDPELQRELQSKLVIQKELPFNFFDDAYTNEYIQNALQPKYRKVSRVTTRRDALKSYLKAKNELIKEFNSLESKISLTSDVWSANHQPGVSYICTTAHWIDSEWRLNKRIIAFEYFEVPHNGTSIYSQIFSVIDNFAITNKIMSISFDNASSNTVAVNNLSNDILPMLDGAFFHVRCVCHILNLIVRDGLTFITPQINKIRDMLTCIYTSKKRRQDFKKYCHDHNAKFIAPKFDNNTRWNSTYLMLLDAYKRRNLLMPYYNSVWSHDLTPADWAPIEEILNILHVFYTCTVELSSVYYPTINRVLQILCMITTEFAKYRDHPVFYSMIRPMEEKFNKYFEDMPPVFYCAAALNPLCKQAGVNSLIHTIEDNMCTNNADYKKNKFNQIFSSFYQHYNAIYGIHRQQTSSVGASSSSSSKGKSISSNMFLLRTLSSSRHRNTSVTDTDELSRFCNTDFSCFYTEDEIINFDMLKFWSIQHKQFPTLAAMVRDILTIQASTVASESCFSLSGRILDEKRSRLSPESLEVCICYKDYLAAQRRMQDQIDDEDSTDDPEVEDTPPLESGESSRP